LWVDPWMIWYMIVILMGGDDWELESSRKGSAWSWLIYSDARSADPFLEDFELSDITLIEI